MDVTKFFEPVRGIVEYLISRLGTLIVTSLILAINFDFSGIFTGAADYSGQYKYVYDSVFTTLSSDNRSSLATIIIVFIFIGALEAHSAVLNFLDRLSPITFEARPATYEPFEHDISFIWRYYCKDLSLYELETLHRIRREMEDRSHHSRRVEIFDYISGWIFLVIILAFSLEIKSVSIFIFTLIIFLVAGWLGL